MFLVYVVIIEETGALNHFLKLCCSEIPNTIFSAQDAFHNFCSKNIFMYALNVERCYCNDWSKRYLFLKGVKLAIISFFSKTDVQVDCCWSQELEWDRGLVSSHSCILRNIFIKKYLSIILVHKRDFLTQPTSLQLYMLIFYQNTLCKNVEAEICRRLKNILRFCPGSNSNQHQKKFKQ